jgi:hypothetical protein
LLARRTPGNYGPRDSSSSAAAARRRPCGCGRLRPWSEDGSLLRGGRRRPWSGDGSLLRGVGRRRGSRSSVCLLRCPARAEERRSTNYSHAVLFAVNDFEGEFFRLVPGHFRFSVPGLRAGTEGCREKVRFEVVDLGTVGSPRP